MTGHNSIGANTWIWVSPLTDERLAGLAPRIKGLGFDLIELPIEEPGDWDPVRTGGVLAGLGLGASTCAVMPSGRDLAVRDPDVVETTQEYLRRCLEMAAAVGSRVLSGPLYSAVGRTWPMDAQERRATLRRVAENLRPVADHAQRLGIVLAIEPLNRFETSLINTAGQALELIDLVASDAVGVLLDSFHMNIEERDPAAAIRACGSRLAHFHACGNDRGAPGGDHIDWESTAAALRDAGYQGSVCIESFTGENQVIARAASIWRPLALSQDALASDGLKFLRQLLGGARP